MRLFKRFYAIFALSEFFLPLGPRKTLEAFCFELDQRVSSEQLTPAL